MNDFNAWVFDSTWYTKQSTVLITDILLKFPFPINKPHIFWKVRVLSTRLWMIKQNQLNVGIFRSGKGKRYLTLEQCFNKMYIANNVCRDCHFVYGFIFVLSITYYSMNPCDNCSACYLVAKRCWRSKLSDPFTFDPFSVKRVLLCIWISMSNSRAIACIVPDKYQLYTYFQR